MARTTDPERTRARRKAISDAAAGLFAAQGFEATTAADIARDAGLSSGSVFYYFADKRAVFRSIFEADLPAARELIARHADGADPLGSVLAVVDELVAPVEHATSRGILVELLRQAGHDPQLQDVLIETARVTQQGLADLVARAQADGLADPDLDAAEAAGWIQVIVDGIFLNGEPGQDPRPMARRIVRALLATPRRPAPPHTVEEGTS